MRRPTAAVAIAVVVSAKVDWPQQRVVRRLLIDRVQRRRLDPERRRRHPGPYKNTPFPSAPQLWHSASSRG
jgi:hypothetical protein